VKLVGHLVFTCGLLKKGKVLLVLPHRMPFFTSKRNKLYQWPCCGVFGGLAETWLDLMRCTVDVKVYWFACGFASSVQKYSNFEPCGIFCELAKPTSLKWNSKKNE